MHSMARDLEQRVHEIVARAATEIADAARRDVTAQLDRILAGVSEPNREPARARVPRQAAAAKVKPTKARRDGRRRRGGPSEQDISKVLAFVESNPGLRSEEIQKRMGGEPKIIKAALAKLRDSKSVKTNGVKRAMIYSAV